MSKYHRLTREERYQIEVLVKSGDGVRSIARKLGRSCSTVSEELSKYRGKYVASRADYRTQQKRKRPRPDLRVIKGEVRSFVCSKLMDFIWSPEQISEVLKREKRKSVSHQTIYRFIERSTQEGLKLKSYLRILRKQRKGRRKKLYKTEKEFFTSRPFINQRPKIVEKRKRLGDYERDTVLGKRNGPFLLTVVDRTTRRLKLACLSKFSAENVHRATVRLLRNEPVKTITNDNGSEFHFHHKTAKALDAKVYFSHSYRAWERGTNENMNGLLRQIFPRKKPIPMLSRRQERQIENLLNTRPRKCLGFKTPNEIYKTLKRQVFG